MARHESWEDVKKDVIIIDENVDPDPSPNPSPDPAPAITDLESAWNEGYLATIQFIAAQESPSTIVASLRTDQIDTLKRYAESNKKIVLDAMSWSELPSWLVIIHPVHQDVPWLLIAGIMLALILLLGGNRAESGDYSVRGGLPKVRPPRSQLPMAYAS